MTDAAREEREKVVAWLPIETAPRDKCVLLASLAFANAAGIGAVWNITVGYWDAEFVFDWNDETDQTEYRGAWTDDTVASWGMEERTELRPTHWMPLPSPPAIERGEHLREGGEG